MNKNETLKKKIIGLLAFKTDEELLDMFIRFKEAVSNEKPFSIENFRIDNNIKAEIFLEYLTKRFTEIGKEEEKNNKNTAELIKNAIKKISS